MGMIVIYTGILRTFFDIEIDDVDIDIRAIWVTFEGSNNGIILHGWFNQPMTSALQVDPVAIFPVANLDMAIHRNWRVDT